MRRAVPAALLVSLFVAAAAATPAFAGYGALARDNATGKFGLSWDKPTQKQADDLALKDCAESSCKIVFRTRSHQCGAIATADKGNGWGASDKGARKDTVELRAMKTCQEHASGQCKVRASGCNR